MNNRIIHIIILSLLFGWSYTGIPAQVSMYFCSTHAEERLYTGCAEVFCTSAIRGDVNVILIASPGKTINASNILYLIHKDTVCIAKVYEHNLQPRWTYYCRPMDFFQPGNYTIEAYDMDDYLDSDHEYGTLICTGYLKIDDRCDFRLGLK